MRLMAVSSGAGIDFTLTFRALSSEPPADADGIYPDGIFPLLEQAALQNVNSWPSDHRAGWSR
jgi:hypothetical protein